MMSAEKIKQTAVMYANTMIKNEQLFFDMFDRDKEYYSQEESSAVIHLANVYYNCKTGKISRKEAGELQKEILRGVGK